MFETGVSVAVSPEERLKLWVRAGGRCAICKVYVLESGLTFVEFPLGEGAHIVGSKNSAASPRGLSPIPEADRGRAENLILLCPTCHAEIDHKLQQGLFDVPWLAARKLEHEAAVRNLTGKVEDGRTVLLRLIGHVRSGPAAISAQDAVAAVLAQGRIPAGSAPDGVLLDLRQLPGEDAADDEYYLAAQRRIDEVVERRLKPAVEGHGVHHLSVFGIARLPILVYLGSRLDDVVPADIYQLHRAAESWRWPEDAEAVCFQHRLEHEAGGGAEGVIVFNVSGTIHSSELPGSTSGLTRWVLRPKGATPSTDLVATPQTRDNFVSAFRHLLAEMEDSHKSIRRLHVFAAVPVSVAVSIGRSVGWGMHPSLLTYDRTEDGYRPTPEVTAQ